MRLCDVNSWLSVEQSQCSGLVWQQQVSLSYVTECTVRDAECCPLMWQTTRQTSTMCYLHVTSPSQHGVVYRPIEPTNHQMPHCIPWPCLPLSSAQITTRLHDGDVLFSREYRAAQTYQDSVIVSRCASQTEVSIISPRPPLSPQAGLTRLSRVSIDATQHLQFDNLKLLGACYSRVLCSTTRTFSTFVDRRELSIQRSPIHFKTFHQFMP